MPSIDLLDIKDIFHKLVLPFHQIERNITLAIPSHRADNDAEHSWSLSLLAISLAPHIDSKLDIGKVSILATVHDLVEINAGDTSFWADDKFIQSKASREEKALQQLEKDLPKFSHLFAYIHEYEARETDEARFVYALDKFLNLLMVVEDGGYFHLEHRITREKYNERMPGHIAKAHTHSGVAIYYEELRDLFEQNPNHFYIA